MNSDLAELSDITLLRALSSQRVKPAFRMISDWQCLWLGWVVNKRRWHFTRWWTAPIPNTWDMVMVHQLVMVHQFLILETWWWWWWRLAMVINGNANEAVVMMLIEIQWNCSFYFFFSSFTLLLGSCRPFWLPITAASNFPKVCFSLTHVYIRI